MLTPSVSAIGNDSEWSGVAFRFKHVFMFAFLSSAAPVYVIGVIPGRTIELLFQDCGVDNRADDPCGCHASNIERAFPMEAVAIPASDQAMYDMLSWANAEGNRCNHRHWRIWPDFSASVEITGRCTVSAEQQRNAALSSRIVDGGKMCRKRDESTNLAKSRYLVSTQHRHPF